MLVLSKYIGSACGRVCMKLHICMFTSVTHSHKSCAYIILFTGEVAITETAITVNNTFYISSCDFDQALWCPPHKVIIMIE